MNLLELINEFYDVQSLNVYMFLKSKKTSCFWFVIKAKGYEPNIQLKLHSSCRCQGLSDLFHAYSHGSSPSLLQTINRRKNWRWNFIPSSALSVTDTAWRRNSAAQLLSYINEAVICSRAAQKLHNGYVLNSNFPPEISAKMSILWGMYSKY